MKTSLKQRLLALLMSALLLVSFCGAAALAEAEIPSPGVATKTAPIPKNCAKRPSRWWTTSTSPLRATPHST